jgi:glycosyltransferase involved in cell wall biosynthesis
MQNEMNAIHSEWAEEWKVGNPQSHDKNFQHGTSKRSENSATYPESFSHLAPELPQDGPKILWGITSAYQDDMEVRRRGVVRATYLSYYKNNDHFVSNPDRICSLADVLEKRVHWERCQLAYTFVMGGNPEGAQEFIDPTANSQQYLVDHNNIESPERDVTYLNIKENQFGGKMQTWFAYASSLIKEGYTFDYVAKADSDTMLYPEEFLAQINLSLPREPTAVYSGVSVSRKHCGKKNDEHCNKMLDEYYMGGAAEILSADLAHHVASLSEEQRRHLEISNHEDITIGNFVLSHGDVTKVELGKPWGYKVRRRRIVVPFLWRHDKKTKQPGKWLANFFAYEKDKRRRDTTRENILVVPTSYNNELLIKTAIKSACGQNRKTVVEYCAMTFFAGKPELYLSRFTTDILSVNDVDANNQLAVQLEPPTLFRYSPKEDEEIIKEENEIDEAEEEDAIEEKDEDEVKTEESPVLPWNETVVVIVRNPVNDNLKEWVKVMQPNAPYSDMSIRSKNGHALSQLQKSTVGKIYIIRAEHFWDDLVRLEGILGNFNPIKSSDWPALTDPSVEVMVDLAHGKRMPLPMCCHLLHEIEAYQKLLLLGHNLQNPQESIHELFGLCGVASVSDLENRC